VIKVSVACFLKNEDCLENVLYSIMRVSTNLGGAFSKWYMMCSRSLTGINCIAWVGHFDACMQQAEHEADYIETKTLTDVQIENILYALYSKSTDNEGKHACVFLGSFLILSTFYMRMQVITAYACRKPT
jgi:hypothetical protein